MDANSGLNTDGYTRHFGARICSRFQVIILKSTHQYCVIFRLLATDGITTGTLLSVYWLSNLVLKCPGFESKCQHESNVNKNSKTTISLMVGQPATWWHGTEPNRAKLYTPILRFDRKVTKLTFQYFTITENWVQFNWTEEKKRKIYQHKMLPTIYYELHTLVGSWRKSLIGQQYRATARTGNKTL